MRWGKAILPLLVLLLFSKMEVYGADERQIKVQLKSGEEAAENNLKALKSAFAQGGQDKVLRVTVSKRGIYYIGSDKRSSTIKIRSNTIFDLNGATLIRNHNTGNFIQNVSSEGKQDIGGYDLSTDITIMNGVLDGGKYINNSSNIINIGHAKNVTIQNVSLRNIKGGHFLEFAGVKDSLVKSCTFSNSKGNDPIEDIYEAIQIESCSGLVDAKWNNTYLLDKTACKNITITDCQFYDCTYGVGNHHAIAQNHCQNIFITNNIFYSRNSDGFAIRSCAFDNLVIKNNTILGKFSRGISIHGGSALITGNKIGSADEYFKGRGILVYDGESVIDKEPYFTSEKVSRIDISNNKIFGNCEKNMSSIAIYSSKLPSDIYNNKIYNKTGGGIRISGNQVSVKNISGNIICVNNNFPIVVCGSKVTTIEKNRIEKALSKGIFIKDMAKVKKIKDNVIRNTRSDAIYIDTYSDFLEITKNTIYRSKRYGVVYPKKKHKVKVKSNIFYYCTNGKIKVIGRG